MMNLRLIEFHMNYSVLKSGANSATKMPSVFGC
jgi:hypothetical protein